MKITWVEKLADAKAISPRAKTQIYTDIVKLARFGDNPTQTKLERERRKAKFMERTPAESFLLDWVAKPLGAMALMKGVSAAMDYATNMGKTENANANRTALAESYTGRNLEKAQARFDEISSIAPSMAQRPEYMNRLIKNKLHTGLTDDDVMKLVPMEVALQSPDYKVPEKLKKKASIHAGNVCADVLALVSSHVGDDFIKEAVARGAPKSTRGGSLSSKVIKLLAFSTVPVLAGVGTGVAKDYLATRDAKNLAVKIRDSYQKAIELDKRDPDGGFLTQDKEKALQAFKTLNHFAPQVAADPLAAKTFMKKLVQMNDIQSTDVKDLTDIQRNISQITKGSPFIEGFTKGIDYGGLTGVVKDPIKDIGETLGGS